MAYNLVIDYISELLAERFSSVSTAETKTSTTTNLQMFAKWGTAPGNKASAKNMKFVLRRIDCLNWGADCV